MFVYLAGPESLKERQKAAYHLLTGRVGKFKRGKMLLIGYLSVRARKFKREAKKLFIVCLFGRARKFKRKAKVCFLFVYLTGPGSLKERQKVVYCLFIRPES